MLLVDLVERAPFSDVGEKHGAFDDVFHGQPASGQRSFNIQHHLFGFDRDATRYQIAILILADLTGEKEQIACLC
jgi:hypothetical protein